MKIALFGAGSAQFGYGTLGDIFQSRILAGAEIALMDINPESVETVRKTARDFIEARNLPFTLTATTDRRTALRGADFVIISIEVGDRFALWEQDWTLPQQYGIRQIYGENGGPGGLFHALRIIPPILEICGDAVELCPEATIFCYSNPMTAITTTVHRKYPGIRFIGMCHEIASIPRYLPSILSTPEENLRYRAAGLNHFSVLLEASYRDSGEDAYPDILAEAPEFFSREPGYSEIWQYVQRTGENIHTEGARERFMDQEGASPRPWSDRWLFREILESFRLLPITVDSHLGEYISWAEDAADHRGIKDFFVFYRDALGRAVPSIDTGRMHERVVPIMEGMISDSGYEEPAVNILNDGYIPDLPSWVAVEVPALIGRSGPRGIAFPDYPKGFGALLRNYTGVYDLTAEAVLKGSKEAALQALLVSPVVHVSRGLKDLIDQVQDFQKPWLDYLSWENSD